MADWFSEPKELANGKTSWKGSPIERCQLFFGVENLEIIVISSEQIHEIDVSWRCLDPKIFRFAEDIGPKIWDPPCHNNRCHENVVGLAGFAATVCLCSHWTRSRPADGKE